MATPFQSFFLILFNQHVCFFLSSYFHKIPAEPPELELKATHDLASPQEFSMPSPHAMWSADTYAGFDASKANPPKVKSSAL